MFFLLLNFKYSFIAIKATGWWIYFSSLLSWLFEFLNIFQLKIWLSFWRAFIFLRKVDRAWHAIGQNNWESYSFLTFSCILANSGTASLASVLPCSNPAEFPFAFHKRGIIFQPGAHGYSLSPCVIPIFMLELGLCCKIIYFWVPWQSAGSQEPGCARVAPSVSVQQSSPALAVKTGISRRSSSHGHAAAPSTGRNSSASQIIVNGTQETAKKHFEGRVEV